MKIELKLSIDKSTADQTATDLLSAEAGLSKQKIKDAMSKGAAWIRRHNKARKRLRRVKEVLKPGDQIELYYDEALLNRIPPEPQCLHDAQGYSVWFKPAGLVAQGNDWSDHLALLRIAEQKLEPKRQTYLVHRLDRETSGLMLIAHNQGIAANLSGQFQQRKVNKHYRCEVLGETSKAGEITRKLDGKSAITRFERLNYNAESNTSWLDVEILTGRTHQIRRHLESIKHPVIGDPKYGCGNKNDAGLQLYAVLLAFDCPITKHPVRFELSDDFLTTHAGLQLSETD